MKGRKAMELNHTNQLSSSGGRWTAPIRPDSPSTFTITALWILSHCCSVNFFSSHCHRDERWSNIDCLLDLPGLETLFFSTPFGSHLILSYCSSCKARSQVLRQSEPGDCFKGHHIGTQNAWKWKMQLWPYDYSNCILYVSVVLQEFLLQLHPQKIHFWDVTIRPTWGNATSLIK